MSKRQLQTLAVLAVVIYFLPSLFVVDGLLYAVLWSLWVFSAVDWAIPRRAVTG